MKNNSKFMALYESTKSTLTENNAKDELNNLISIKPDVNNGAAQSFIDHIQGWEEGRMYEGPLYDAVKYEDVSKIINDVVAAHDIPENERYVASTDGRGGRYKSNAYMNFTYKVSQPSGSYPYKKVKLPPAILKALVAHVESVYPESVWLKELKELKQSSKGMKATKDPRTKLKDVKAMPEYKSLIDLVQRLKRTHGVVPTTNYVDGTKEGGQKLAKNWNKFRSEAIEVLRLGDMDKFNAMVDKVTPTTNLGGGGSTEYSSITWGVLQDYPV